MKPENCPGENKLLAYCLGNLPENEMQFLEEHVGTCDECQSTVENLENHADTLIDQLQRPAAPSKFSGEPELQQALDQAIAHPGGKPVKDAAQSEESAVESGEMETDDNQRRPEDRSPAASPPEERPAAKQAADRQDRPTGKAPQTAEEYEQCVVTSGLMSRKAVRGIINGLPYDARPADARGLARALVQADKLTKFQAAVILQGKSHGLRFGEYDVMDRIGAGGMGQVFKARHRTMDRLAAIKVISAERLDSEDAVLRFQQEVRAAAKLIHPNVVITHDAGERRGVHYMVMEYVDGCDLAELCKERGPLPVDEAVDYVCQAAEGLQFAHDHGIVHRDVKPGNLMVTRMPNAEVGMRNEDDSPNSAFRIPHSTLVKILDMGLARLREDDHPDEPDAGQITGADQIMGTADYMSPEQAEDTHAADNRSDIYSLGCTLYRLLTDKPVYPGDTPIKRLLAHREAPIPSVRDKRPEVPPEVDAVFQRMVAKRPDERYQSMRDVIQALQAALEGEAPDAPATGAPSTSADEDGSLTNFLANLRDETQTTPPPGRQKTPADGGALGTAAEPQPAPKQQKTREVAPRDGTAPGAARPAAKRKTKKRAAPPAWLAALRRPKTQMPLLIGALVGLLLIGSVILGTILYIQTPYGMVVVETDDEDVEVLVKQDGDVVEIANAKNKWRVEVRRGTYRVELRGGNDRFELDKDTIKVSRRGEVRVRVELKPPQVAGGGSGEGAQASLPKPQLPARAPVPTIAPFDKKTANELQEAWAKYLGVTVEREFALPGGAKMKMVLIPPGTFTMGGFDKDGEGPQHLVRITRPFYIGVHEVTQAEYGPMMHSRPWSEKEHAKEGAAYPATYVSWHDAVEFCNRLGEREGCRCRLPTEAEWEYACRAGTTTWYTFGNTYEGELFKYANYCDVSNTDGLPWQDKVYDDGHDKVAPAGSYRPNAWALYDTHGNVWEWCQDWYSSDYYRASRERDPQGPVSGTKRVTRGGGWRDGFWASRSAARREQAPVDRNGELGFRVVCEIPYRPESKSDVLDGRMTIEQWCAQYRRIWAEEKAFSPARFGELRWKDEAIVVYGPESPSPGRVDPWKDVEAESARFVPDELEVLQDPPAFQTAGPVAIVRWKPVRVRVGGKTFEDHVLDTLVRRNGEWRAVASVCGDWRLTEQDRFDAANPQHNEIQAMLDACCRAVVEKDLDAVRRLHHPLYRLVGEGDAGAPLVRDLEAAMQEVRRAADEGLIHKYSKTIRYIKVAGPMAVFLEKSRTTIQECEQPVGLCLSVCSRTPAGWQWVLQVAGDWEPVLTKSRDELALLDHCRRVRDTWVKRRFADREHYVWRDHLVTITVRQNMAVTVTYDESAEAYARQQPTYEEAVFDDPPLVRSEGPLAVMWWKARILGGGRERIAEWPEVVARRGGEWRTVAGFRMPRRFGPDDRFDAALPENRAIQAVLDLMGRAYTEKNPEALRPVLAPRYRFAMVNWNQPEDAVLGDAGALIQKIANLVKVNNLQRHQHRIRFIQVDGPMAVTLSEIEDVIGNQTQTGRCLSVFTRSEKGWQLALSVAGDWEPALTTEKPQPEVSDPAIAPFHQDETPREQDGAAGNSRHGVRTWSDGAGHEVEAAFVKLEDGVVHLRRQDGKVVEIRLEILSGPDRAYVADQADRDVAP